MKMPNVEISTPVSLNRLGVAVAELFGDTISDLQPSLEVKYAFSSLTRSRKSTVSDV
jgi:hypothetical protein